MVLPGRCLLIGGLAHRQPHLICCLPYSPSFYTLPSPAPNAALFSFLAFHAQLFCQTPNFIIPPLSSRGLQFTSQVLARKVKYRLQSLTKDHAVSEQPNATLYPFLWQPAHPTPQKDTLPHTHRLQDFSVH